jgi:hypothetical protein
LRVYRPAAPLEAMRAKRDGSSSFPRTRTRSAYGLFTFQTAHLVPAARFLRPGFVFPLRSPNLRGGGAPRDVRVLARHPLGLHVTRQVRRLTRRLASHNAGRSPPGAPPWRFWAGRRAFPSPAAPLKLALRRATGSVTASSSHTGRSARRAGCRTSRGKRLRVAAAGRHSSLRL